MSKQARTSTTRHPRRAGSQAYRLASEGLEFLAKDHLRPLRLQEEGAVDRGDIALFQFADRADQAVQIVHDFYGARPPE